MEGRFFHCTSIMKIQLRRDKIFNVNVGKNIDVNKAISMNVDLNIIQIE